MGGYAKLIRLDNCDDQVRQTLQLPAVAKDGKLSALGGQPLPELRPITTFKAFIVDVRVGGVNKAGIEYSRSANISSI